MCGLYKPIPKMGIICMNWDFNQGLSIGFIMGVFFVRSCSSLVKKWEKFK